MYYPSLPFETKTTSALSKFYNYMPGDIKDRINQMKNRVDFEAPMRHSEFPYFSKFFIGLGNEAMVTNPPEMVDCIKLMLSELMAKYV